MDSCRTLTIFNNGLIICWSYFAIPSTNLHYYDVTLPITYPTIIRTCNISHVLSGKYTDLPSQALFRWGKGNSTLNKIRILFNITLNSSAFICFICIGN